MNAKQDIDERKIIIEKNRPYSNETSASNSKELMLFLSFDITDSTRIKVQYPKKWSKIVNILTSNSFPYMHYWKFNGDEMLYKRKVDSLEFICDLIKKSYSHLKTLQNSMKKEIPEISIKATIWLALTETDVDNYEFNFTFFCGDEVDFVGKSMDEGFRLTKCSSMQKIAIDPKIVYILLDTYEHIALKKERDENTPFFASKNGVNLDGFISELNGIIEKIHLVGYAKGKGVWNENPVPIYWYYENIPKDDIQYNEHLNGEHLWPKKSSNEIIPIKEREYNNIHQIFQQMGITKEITAIYQLLNIKGEIKMSAEGRANLYYMVACVNPKTGNVLIAKRAPDRKHLKNVWDFGNVKHQNIHMEETIVKEYKNMFGIDIELETDSNRGNNLIPYGYCTIYRNCKPHNSILCHAKITKPSNLDDAELAKYINQKKATGYSEVRFVNGDDVKDFKSLTIDQIKSDSEMAELGKNNPFKDDTCIMYFENSIRGVIHGKR